MSENNKQRWFFAGLAALLLIGFTSMAIIIDVQQRQIDKLTSELAEATSDNSTTEISYID